MKKKLILIFLVIGLMLMGIEVAFAGGQSEEGETLTLKYGEMSPPGHTGTEAGEEVARIVKERTDGRINIEVYPGGQLGGHQEVITGVQSGALGMARSNVGYLASAGWEKLAVLTLPFIYNDYNSAWEVLSSDIGQGLLDDMEEEPGVVGLGYLIAYPRNFFFADQRVEQLEDIEGLDVRVQPGDIYLDMVQAFGANAVAIDFGELYSAIQTGVVDGAENPTNGYVSNNFHEVTEYYTLTKHQIDPAIITINAEVWNSLSDTDQDIFRDAIAQAQESFRNAVDQEEEESREIVREAGVEIIEVEDRDKWREASSVVYDKYSEYSDLIDSILDMQK